jgi:hypothetical protein
MRRAADLMFLIAGLSAVYMLVGPLNGSLALAFAPAFVPAIIIFARDLVDEGAPFFGLLVCAPVIACFPILGIMAQRRQTWAFAVATVLYVFDVAGLLLATKAAQVSGDRAFGFTAALSLVIHCLVIWRLASGFNARLTDRANGSIAESLRVQALLERKLADDAMAPPPPAAVFTYRIPRMPPQRPA